jgi:IS605 OrfB family transposase
MKLIRSTKLTLKFANNSKKEQLRLILNEYSKVVNFFIDLFWENPTSKAELLKPIIDKANTWLCARTRKVAAREAIDMIRSAKNKAKECNEAEVKPQHYGKRMCFSAQNIKLKESHNTFDAWLHLYSIGNKTLLDLPLKGHKHLNKLKAIGKRLESYIITENYVQVCYQIETGPKLEEGEIVGVDSGINALASLDTGEQYGKEIKTKIERVKRCQQNSKGQRKARRALKQYIDETAKEVTKNKRLVVVEKLKQLNNKTKLKRRLSKNMRRSLGIWNYRYWLMRVESNCQIRCSSFRTVAPQYTSQRCYICGHTERGNRDGEKFECRSCGHIDNADVNAAKNILLRFTTGPYGAGFKQKNSELGKFS